MNDRHPIDQAVKADPRPAMRKAAKARTTAKVLEAARDLFAEVGYEKATIRDIADRAKMSTGAVFSNYENKAALYKAAHGHAPITPEQGRRLLTSLQKLIRGEEVGAELVTADALISEIEGKNPPCAT